jgi:hypothetical protein
VNTSQDNSPSREKAIERSGSDAPTSWTNDYFPGGKRLPGHHPDGVFYSDGARSSKQTSPSPIGKPAAIECPLPEWPKYNSSTAM